MVKSKPSMTGSGMAKTGAGSYPKFMESLKDGLGHVSLNPGDYAGYSPEEVAAFFASLDYEVGWWVNENGEVIYVDSQFRPSSVNGKLPLGKAIDQANAGVTSIEDLHNHPITTNPNDGTLALFSPDDINFYVDNTPNYPISKVNEPIYNKYTVHTQTGDVFSLRYHGYSPSNKSLDQFKADYSVMFRMAQSFTNNAVNNGSVQRTNRAYADNVGSILDNWLRKNSQSYGLDYESTWNKKGVLK